MNTREYPTKSLCMMHNAIRDALVADLSSGEERYGVRLFSDWAEHRDAIEAELHARGATFYPIVW